MDKVEFAGPQMEERQAKDGTLQNVIVSLPMVRKASGGSVSFTEGGSSADPVYRVGSNSKSTS
jgi:hypothetical protein